MAKKPSRGVSEKTGAPWPSKPRVGGSSPSERAPERCVITEESGSSSAGAASGAGELPQLGPNGIEVLARVLAEDFGVKPPGERTQCHHGGACRFQRCAAALDAAVAEHERLKADNAALLADGGALFRDLREAHSVMAEAWPARPIVKVLAATLDSLHPGAALLEEHRKELVRARNAGLEEAALYCDERASMGQGWEAWATAAKAIRALKEAES